MGSKKLSYLYLGFAVVSFSLFEIISKTLVGNISPFQLTLVRFFVGGLALFPFAVSHILKYRVRFEKKDILSIIFLGFLNVCVSMVLIQIGMQYTQANISAVIISSNPIVVAFLSSFILKEKLTPGKLVGLLVGVLGVLIALNKQNADHENFYLGLVLQVLGMCAFSLYTVFGKKVAKRIGSVSFNSFCLLAGSIMLLPIVLIMGISPLEFSFQHIWMQMIYLCIINTGLAFFFYFKALERLDTSLGSMTFFVKPVLASLLAAIFLNEALTVNLAIGIILILTGIYLVKRDVEDIKNR